MGVNLGTAGFEGVLDLAGASLSSFHESIEDVVRILGNH
jgi:hypothetical protein